MTAEEFIAWYETVNLDLPDGYGFDCDDYAHRLQTAALAQGYALSIALVRTDGRYFGTTVRTPMEDSHAGCLVLIGNDYWYVEPQPAGFKMVDIAYRD